MEFIDTKVFRKYRFALGFIENSGEKYLSIPVANQLVDYEEYYRVSDLEYECLIADVGRACEFAEKCRNREMDDRLIVEPGSDRGVAS